MNLNPFSWFRRKDLTLDQAIQRFLLLTNSAANITVTPETALKAPTVYAIVDLLSKSVARLPVSIYQDESTPDKRRVTKQPQHVITKLLSRRPNEWMTPFEYWTLVMTWLLLWGKFYAKKVMGRGGNIIALEPLRPDKVQVEQLLSGRLQFTVTQRDGSVEILPQNQMHWINRLTLDGIEGTTAIAQCKESIALEIAAEEFGARTFGSGAVPNVILKHPTHFRSAEQVDEFRKSWDKAFRKRRGTAVLEDGMELEVVQMNNEESQFLETRKFQRSVIAGAFGVPPHAIGDLERATFSNIEQMSLNFVVHTLAPYLECIESAIMRDLLSRQEVERGMLAQFDTRQMLRGDAKSRAEALRTLRQWGIINANEWRAMEGMDARLDDGGDDYLTPLNMIPDGEDAERDANAPGNEQDSDVTAIRSVR